MTINYILEGILGKISLLKGDNTPDATPFSKNSVDVAEKLATELQNCGFKSNGSEIMYSGFSGKPLVAEIYMGSVYYQRLKHLVVEKQHCLTGDHEVLTLLGWKNIKEITIQDQVATLNDNELIYDNPINIFQYPNYIGKIYHISNSNVDLTSTENHRMWVSILDEKTGEYSPYHFEEAKNLIDKIVKYKKDVEWNKEDYQFVLINKVDMNAWLIFFGIWIANKVNQDNEKCIQISTNDQEVKNILILSLNTLEYKYIVDNEIIEIYNFEVFNYIRHLKSFPQWVFELSSKQAKILLNSILFGNKHFDTLNEILADQIQQLCLHAGYICTIDNKNLKISISTSDLSIDYNSQKEIFEDRAVGVYCLEVPSGIFYVRKGGKSAWTGNSRSYGPIQQLSHQPLAGRSKDGGLRIGEMERDCLISHGISYCLLERLFYMSDFYQVLVCNACGTFGKMKTCVMCNSDKLRLVNLPYACQLLFHDLLSCNIRCKINANDELVLA